MCEKLLLSRFALIYEIYKKALKYDSICPFLYAMQKIQKIILFKQF